jgi:hypothetical protein
MCFSAEASFGAGAILTVVGIATIKQCKQPQQLAFAAIPLFFGIQQIAEGFVWLSLTKAQFTGWQKMATYLFTFFSHILWPVWVAFAVLLFETVKKKKNILFAVFILGLLLSLAEVYSIAKYGIVAMVKGHHIEYTIVFPAMFKQTSEVVYALTTLLPCFICSFKKIRLFAIMLMIAIVVSSIFYKAWFISVWCFFAAFLSVVIFYIIQQANKAALQKNTATLVN